MARPLIVAGGRSMRVMLIAAVLALVGAFVWGYAAQSQRAPNRPHDLVAPVTDSWRESLPRDAHLAALAYLNRVPEEMRARGEAVANSRYVVLVARFGVGIAAILLFLFTAAGASLSTAVARVARWRWAQDILFATAFFLLLFVLALPVETYAGYVRWRHFGFADRPYLDWLSDFAVSWATITVFYVAGLAAFMAMIRRTPKSWVGWASAIYLALASLYVVVMPVLIEPMTNQYTPIPDSPLKQDILGMARANGVPANDVFTANASRQSRLLNAHVSGVFGTARISIDDTTLSGQYEPGILMVVGHEIGHYVMGHIYYSVLITTLIAGVGFLLISWLGPFLISKFGGAWRITDMSQTAAIAVFWLLFTAWTFVSDPLNNAYTRWQESQADLYGLNASQAPHGMAEFMIHDADIARLTPTPLDVLLFYDHPSDKSRVETAMRWRAQHWPVLQVSPSADQRLSPRS
jgi:STE24 endopeptidase